MPTDSRSNHPMYRDGGGLEQDSRLTADYHSMDVQQLDRRRQDEMARQDDLLDDLHRGVKGLNYHARAIDGEVVEQNELIDDIGNRMDRAQVDLERGEAKAREVNARKAKKCKLYGVIALLIVWEIVLFIVDAPFLTKKKKE
ncbi:hypothetical protein P43SY_003751 [Pythium insidiosum]|uniref:t-SNARE coiled-coil homology domain-containing protein n=1 Tax=Pythium insidiosum TaxID=114742 RepID=A0AAD5Q2Y8_PYTIN|nr:hypothetical protein P43SY_003751 [Pythium insidiosum]